MEEIKVGDFIRSNDGYIAKIIGIKKSKRDCDTYYCTDRIMANGFYEHIKKHSSNIIDLIEEGDYVNGSKVLEVCLDSPSGSWIDVDCNKQTEECTFWNPDIKNVVTKEQFEQMKYVLGDE